MSDAVPDNNHLERLASAVEALQDCITIDILLLRNKNADLFERYMAYTRSYFFIRLCEFSGESMKMNLASGHQIHHPALQTEMAKKNGWDTVAKGHPFFIDDDSDEGKEKDSVPSWLKEAFKDAMKEAMKNK